MTDTQSLARRIAEKLLAFADPKLTAEVAIGGMEQRIAAELEERDRKVRELVRVAHRADDELFRLLDVLCDEDCDSVTSVRDDIGAALEAMK